MIPRISWVVLFVGALLTAQEREIDGQRSTITIHAGKAGLFAAAGHEHWIEAPISSGIIYESGAAHVEFSVNATKMRVKPDPKIDPKTQAEIQKDMQEKVLESSKYPEIAFRSSRVERQAAGRWSVEGTLMLHGATRPIAVSVRRSGEAYTGRTTLHQSDFGIKPITAAGGTIKVRNELEIEFHVLVQSE